MLNTKQAVTCLLAMASPLYAADTNVGTPENPNCTASGKPVIPRQFYLDLQRDLAWEEKLGLNPWDQELDDVEQEMFRQEGGARSFIHRVQNLNAAPNFSTGLCSGESITT